MTIEVTPDAGIICADMLFSVALTILGAIQTQGAPTRMMAVNTTGTVGYMGAVYSADLAGMIRSKEVLTLIVPSDKAMSESKDLRKKLGGDKPYILALTIDGIVDTSEIKSEPLSKKSRSGNSISFSGIPSKLKVEVKGVLPGIRSVKSTVKCTNGMVYFID